LFDLYGAIEVHPFQEDVIAHVLAPRIYLKVQVLGIYVDHAKWLLTHFGGRTEVIAKAPSWHAVAGRGAQFLLEIQPYILNNRRDVMAAIDMWRAGAQAHGNPN